MTPRGLLIGLLTSLALNFFLLGAGATVVVIGAQAAKLRAMNAAGQGPLQPARRAAMALPPGPRQDFAAAVKTVTIAERPNAQAIRQLRLEAWTALSADKVDAPAIKAKLDQARTLEMGLRSKIDGAVIDFTAALPQAQRAAVAQEMRPQPQLQQQPDSAKPPGATSAP
jgi:uncharacterized membrane protein